MCSFPVSSRWIRRPAPLFPTIPTSRQSSASRNLLGRTRGSGCKAEDVVKATVFMIDTGEFSVVNEVYAKYFNGECPARCAMQVGALPKGALVEIEAIAVKP